jgi:cytochrome c oxidase subunit 1
MYDESSVDVAEDTGRAEELKARVDGTSDDPTVAHDDAHPNQSPRTGEGQ